MDRNNDPLIHTNRFQPPASMKTSEQLAQERTSRIYKNTHNVSEVSKLPKDVRFWAVSQESMRYDSGYGDRGATDMCEMKYLVITWFEDEEALEAWVLKAVEERKTYQIFRAEPVNTEVKAVFSIKN